MRTSDGTTAADGADFTDAVAGASLVFVAFLALYLALAALAPPTPAQLLASDPLVQLVAARLGPSAIPLLAGAPALTWLLLRPPSRSARMRAVRGALAGAALVGIGLPVLRLLSGPALPGFVPSEESALPGITLGVGAGILEEGLFRLGLLAVAFTVTRRIFAPAWAGAISVVVTALAFALAHELGPGAAAFEPRFFATRFLVPGCLMSALFFRPGPAFLVSLHCVAHVGIALLFAGPAP